MPYFEWTLIGALRTLRSTHNNNDNQRSSMRTAYARSVPSFLAACALLCCTALPALAAAWKPEENLEIVVAGGPGGGTDQLARLVQSAISQNKLLDVNTVVLNKGGGNGAEAFLDLKLAKGNAHKLVIGTNNVYLLPLVARLGYQWTDLTPVAAVAEDDFILWPYQAAPWADAAAFLADLKKDATGMRFGGSQSKDVDQTLSLLLGKQVGGKLTYIPFKSGSEASIQLAGRHIAANLNNPAESLSQWRGGQVRPLCVFSHERMIYTAKVVAEQSWADIPTCHEQGLGIDQYRFPRTVFLPGGVSDEQRAFYVELMRKVSQTAEFRDYVERSALAPTFLAGEDLVSYIEKDRQRVIPLFQEAGWLRQ
ncbi:TPA: tripartite tricarboxylate transporter substrate binding protein [Pseudomonas aeruginosa]|nr:tripartite tricarboxylate transporter substrate binding protein [Pseudomonas aeruginosa]